MGRIIVIEDNPVFRDHVCGMLEKAGYRTRTAMIGTTLLVTSPCAVIWSVMEDGAGLWCCGKLSAIFIRFAALGNMKVNFHCTRLQNLCKRKIK